MDKSTIRIENVHVYPSCSPTFSRPGSLLVAIVVLGGTLYYPLIFVLSCYWEKGRRGGEPADRSLYRDVVLSVHRLPLLTVLNPIIIHHHRQLLLLFIWGKFGSSQIW